MRPVRILVVDDEPLIRSTLRQVLTDEGYDTGSVDSGEEALERLRQEEFDVVLLDIWLPGIDGTEVLEHIQEIRPSLRPAVVMISGHGTIETAVKCTKAGAFDFLEKPLSLEKLTVVVKNAAQTLRLERENERLRDDQSERYQIIGESVPMKALRQQLTLMARTNGRVLIYGESGTGKELVAHALHAMSHRAAGPFVPVNCAAIPESLIAPELFGYRKGSFPGADDDKPGKFEQADEGTLFLDEVGDMSLGTQAKVLRVLDTQQVEPAGATSGVMVDVRVVAATNKDLEQEIERGNFREDLFYRLNVIPFFVPPLRERREDVTLLADWFLTQYSRAYGRKPKLLSAEACEALENYSWPGNVRELRNLMERLVILNEQEKILPHHLPLSSTRRSVVERMPLMGGTLQDVRRAAERDYILSTLAAASGNVSRTAETLGLERSHLYRKMKSLGIAPKD